jgi:hypothetical protein
MAISEHFLACKSNSQNLNLSSMDVIGTCLNECFEKVKKIAEGIFTAYSSEQQPNPRSQALLRETSVVSITEQPNAQQVDVVVAVGPGGDAFGPEIIEKITKTFEKNEGQTVKSSLLVGNGTDAICIDGIIDAVKIAKKNQRPISLFINTHGKMINNEHYIDIGGNVWASSRELFKKIKSVLGDEYPYPLSIFMTSCHGGGAYLAAASELPKSTTFVALCKGSETVAGSDVKSFLTKMKPSSWSSSEGLLYSYLSTLRTRIGPVIMCGSGFIDLDESFKNQCGRLFSNDQKAQAHQKLDDLMGKENVDMIIDKIQKASTEYSIYAKDYGSALAVVLATRDPGHRRIEI